MSDYYYEPEKLPIATLGIEAFSVSITGQQLVSVPHIHSSIEILFCTKGSLNVNLDGKSHHVDQGEMILLRSNIVHNITSLSDGENAYHVLKIKLSMILNFVSKDNQSLYLLSLISKNKTAKTVWSRDECRDAFRTVENLLEEQKASDYGSDIASKINAITILLQILRDTKDENQTINASDDLIKRIYNTMTYISQHYAEDLSAKELCRQASLSYNYFSNIFKKITGFAFKDYLINTRISHAEQELLSTDKSITDIATSCGFNSVSYFIATFKRMKNVTPTELRKTLKKEDGFTPVS